VRLEVNQVFGSCFYNLLFVWSNRLEHKSCPSQPFFSSWSTLLIQIGATSTMLGSRRLQFDVRDPRSWTTSARTLEQNLWLRRKNWIPVVRCAEHSAVSRREHRPRLLHGLFYRLHIFWMSWWPDNDLDISLQGWSFFNCALLESDYSVRIKQFYRG
jgi:hypothetical protein